MDEKSNVFSGCELNLETAIQMAVEQLPFDLDTEDRCLVQAFSCWDKTKGQQYWVMHWLNGKQLWRRTFQYNLDAKDNLKRNIFKGGGDLKVTVANDGDVKYVFSR